MGKNFDNFNEETFLKKAVELDKTIDTIKNIKKVPTENINDVLFFINKFFLSLINLEEGSKNHLYTRAHFCSIIYIINNNGKIVSTLTFILLNGSEIMSNGSNPEQVMKRMNKDQTQKNNILSSKTAVEAQYTYNSIIYALKNNAYINKLPESEPLDQNSTKIFDYTEKNKISKLTRLLYDICFNPKKKNIKFRIIGTILPNTGYYDNCKDTLMFLFNCRQAITSTAKKKMAKKDKIGHLGESNTNIRSRIMRNDTIFDLENKIKIQTGTIMELNKNIEKKNIKLFELEKYYRKQVEYLKKYFGFSGDIEILLSGDENTQDYKEAQKIREAKDEISHYKKNIKDLENKIKNKDDEIDKLKVENEIRLNDKTMIKYYFGVNDTKKKKEKDNKSRNDTFNQIEYFEKELQNKDKIIKILQNDLEKKSNIIMSLPKVIKNHLDNKDNESSISSHDIISIKKRNKGIDKSDLIQLARFNNEEIKSLKSKYDNLIMQKDKEIVNNNYQINKIIKDNNEKIKLYEEELMKFYELFKNIINYSKNDFISIITEKNNMVTILKKKEEYQNFLKICENQMNAFNYPFLFRVLNSKNKYPATISKNILEEQLKSKNPNNLINPKEIDYAKEMEVTVINFEDLPSLTIKQIKDFIDKKNQKNNFTMDKKDCEKVSKNTLINIYSNTLRYINELENYVKKYDEAKDNLNDKINKNKELLQKYVEKIKNLNVLLDKEIQKNNKNAVVINSLNKMIEKMQKENIISKNILRYKNDNSLNKTSLTKSKDKYPLLINDQYNTISNNENYYLNYKKASLQFKLRNNTENNYPSTYHPTNVTSGSSSYNKISSPNINNTNNNTNNNAFNKFKTKKRPNSSFQTKNKSGFS
jgi:hypothetical protein